ncbi:FKBP-type peptidyl-prolyl cis-trans isomerase [Methyloterricola oryzae]|uniref:FKBP-type peptidyl-prolyl cis-trans isomerase n=1 Tax=Methyloterricola oryzae TaxID=1495050 RepID=UPI00069C28A1|nr:FKBP-type peptidyl-prolyl cis-trans isomerase [Methyloterricola oryzae]
MRKNFLAFVVMASVAGTGFAKDVKKPESQSKLATEAPLQLKTPTEQASYASGVMTVRNFKNYKIPFDVEVLIRAIRDTAEGKKLAMDDRELNRVLSGLQSDIRRNEVRSREEKRFDNLKKGDAYLLDYKKKEGVQALPNGVLYKAEKTGTGKKPTEDDTVEVIYKGSKLDGTVFDATPEGKPAALKMKQTIPGWREALKLMPVGSKWQIVIPATQAYGDRGVGNVIEPNETLIFDVELVGIK